MDFTETPYAEDFYADLSDLIARYVDIGMQEETAEMVLKMALEDMAEERRLNQKA